MADFSLKRVIIKFFAANWELLYIVLMTSFTIILIICNVIAKNGWDLFSTIMIVWWFCSIYIPRHATTPSRALTMFILFIFLDGLIDSLSTGFWNWIGPPWILPYNYSLYPFLAPTHPITVIYLVILWLLAIPYRSLTIGVYFVTNKYNTDSDDRPQRVEKFFDNKSKRIVLFCLTGLAIVMSFISDWINFLVRPEIPAFHEYIPPVGLWTIGKMAIRTTIVLIVGIYSFYLATREKETKGSSVVILFILLLIISSTTFLIAFI